jgi:hypothetical protein
LSGTSIIHTAKEYRRFWRLSDEDKEIERLKQIALKNGSSDHDPHKSAVAAIASYGVKAIPTLIEIGDKGSTWVQKDALDWIAKIKTEARDKAEGKRT